jgi:hypothetical protein
MGLFNNRPRLLTEKVAEGSLRRTIKRPKNNHERPSQQRTPRKAQCMIPYLAMLDPTLPDEAQIFIQCTSFKPSQTYKIVIYRFAASPSEKMTKL